MGATLAPQLEKTYETPQSLGDEGLHFMHSLESNPLSSFLQSFSALGSFPVSQFFALGDQSIGVSASASVLPMNIQD